MKYLSCDEAGFMSLSCELTCVTYETLKRDGFVSYIWRCTIKYNFLDSSNHFLAIS